MLSTSGLPIRIEIIEANTPYVLFEVEYFWSVWVKENGVIVSRQRMELVGCVAEWVKASFLRRPCLHGLGSTRTLVTLLRPWIRRFTMIISATWLRTSSKFSGQQFEEIHRSIGSLETPKQVRIPPITK